MSDRLNRKDMKHDKFIDEMDHLYGSVRKNAQRLTAMVIGALVVLAIIGGVYYYQRVQERKAQDLLSRAIDVMQEPVGAAEQADPSMPPPKYKTEQEKNAKVEPMFLEVADKYGRTDAADIASLYLAQLAVQKGDVASARPKLEAFVREHSGHLLAATAQMSIYEIDLGAGQAKKVATDVEQKLTAEESVLPKDALLALLARAYEMSGDEAKARDAYQRIINEYPDSPYTIDAQRKVARG